MANLFVENELSYKKSNLMRQSMTKLPDLVLSDDLIPILSQNKEQDQQRADSDLL